LLDATRLQKSGIPTVAIVWDIFERAAQSMAKLQGVPDLAIVVVPQVDVGETTDQQRKKGVAAAEAVLQVWS
jgi:hypothetical protein